MKMFPFPFPKGKGYPNRYFGVLNENLEFKNSCLYIFLHNK